MRNLIAAGLSAAALFAPAHAFAADSAKLQGKVEKDGKSYALTHAVAWQAARPDALVLVFADTDVALMDVKHAFRLKQLAADGKIHGLRFEIDPAHIDLHYVYGKYMLPDWNTYSGAMGAAWERLEVDTINSRIAGKLNSGGVQLEFDLPVTGGHNVEVLTGDAAQHSPQVDALLGYEGATRKGNWKEASKYLTPISAEILKQEVSTELGLNQFRTAGKYMTQLLKDGDDRRREVEKVIVSGDDAAVIAPGFAADFVLINGRWLKI